MRRRAGLAILGLVVLLATMTLATLLFRRTL